MIINMNGAKAPETPSPTLQEKTVTPETLPTVIGPDEGYDGLSQVTVNPDPQLKAENIRSGKTIFGVQGAFIGEVQYSDTLDASNWYYDSGTVSLIMATPKENFSLTDEVIEENTGTITFMEFPGRSAGYRLKRISDEASMAVRNNFTKSNPTSYTFTTNTVDYFEYKITRHLSVSAGVHTFGANSLGSGHTYDIEYILQPMVGSNRNNADTTIIPGILSNLDVTGAESQIANNRPIEKARIVTRYNNNAYRVETDLEIPAFDCDVTAFIRAYERNSYKYVTATLVVSIVSATLVE